MKKITLSAAILAMTMMGCSDMGVDNSVASTSDVKQEQSHNSLAKSIYYDDHNVIRRTLQNMAPTNSHNNGYEWYPYPEAGIGVEMQTRDDLDWDGWEGQGEFHVLAKPYNPNTILVVTAFVSDCDFNYNYTVASCGWHKVGVAYEVNQNIDNVVVHTNPNGNKLSKHKFYMDVGAVSAFVGVWNQGTPYEFVTKAATYNGGLFTTDHGAEKARAIYKTYVLPDVINKLYY